MASFIHTYKCTPYNVINMEFMVWLSESGDEEGGEDDYSMCEAASCPVVGRETIHNLKCKRNIVLT